MATYIKIKQGYSSSMLVPYTTENWAMAGKLVGESTLVDTTYDDDPRTGLPAMYRCLGAINISIIEMDMRHIFSNSDKARDFIKNEELALEEEEIGEAA